MQRFISTTAITILLTSTISTVLAQAPFSKANAITHSAAYPNRVKVTSATYHFGVQVGSSPLSEIRIVVPENAAGRIRIGQIAVTDGTRQPLNTNRTFSGREVTIAFAQPVAAGTMLEIDLNGVRTSDLIGRIWEFAIYSKNVGMNQEIPLGMARIQTYK